MNPDPATLIDITNCGSAIEAELLAQFLNESGVYAHAATLAGSTNPWELGSSVPFRIAVRREDFSRAEELIREFRSHKQEPVEVDWEKVDVGEPEEGVLLPGRIERKHRRHRWRAMRRITFIVVIIIAIAWFGPFALVLVLVAAIAEAAATRAELRSTSCGFCGYSLVGLDPTIRCPECGRLQELAPRAMQPERSTSK